MRTKHAKMYKRTEMYDSTCKDIVKTIKAQMQVKGRSSNCIRLINEHCIGIDSGRDFYYIEDGEFTAVWYNPDTDAILVANPDISFVVHPKR